MGALHTMTTTVFVPYISGTVPGVVQFHPWIAPDLDHTRRDTAPGPSEYDPEKHRPDGQPVFLDLSTARAWVRENRPMTAAQWEIRAVAAAVFTVADREHARFVRPLNTAPWHMQFRCPVHPVDPS